MTATEVRRREAEWGKKFDEAMARLIQPILDKMIELIEKEKKDV